MDESSERWAIRFAAFVSAVFLLFTAWLVVNQDKMEDAIKALGQEQGQTVVYAPGSQHTEGVELYDAPNSPIGQQLPNYTAVDMVCWMDTGDVRWFRIRVAAEVYAKVRHMAGMMFVVQADNVHNQTRVDHC